MYSLRWIGGNEQPDIFSYVYATANFSPQGANRGHYSNPRLDALLDDAPSARTQPGGAPITSRRNRFWRAICPPSISGTGIRSWCTTGG